MATPKDRAVTLRPDEGPAMWTLGGRYTIKVPGEKSEGRLSVLEGVATRAAEPPLHVHTREDEAWYVLDGRITFYLDDVPYVAGTGAFVFAPKNVPHLFTVDVEPTRLLLIAAPAGFEEFALEIGTPADGDAAPPGLALPDPSILGPVAARFGIEIIGPPRRISHPETI